MAKWEKRLESILKTEKQKHIAVYELKDNLHQLIHGFSPLDKNLLAIAIQEEVEDASLLNSIIEGISIEPRYQDKEKQEIYLTIKINITGDFIGHIKIETGSGHRTTDEGRIDIYYVFNSDCNVVSDKEMRVSNCYKQFHDMTVESLVDIWLDKNIYLEYDDYFNNYTLWHKRPSEYGDSIHGDLKIYKDYNDCKFYKKKYDSLQKLKNENDIVTFAEEKLYGSYQSTTYEWTEFKL